MRNIIVKLFALNYICNVFGKTITFVRAANIIFPLMAITGIVTVLGDNFSLDSTFGLILLSLTAISVFFGFFYFKLKPIKWEELDKSQKWQYGKAVKSQGDSLEINMTKDQFIEWNMIDEEILETYKLKNFYNIKALLVNVIVFILIIITMIL